MPLSCTSACARTHTHTHTHTHIHTHTKHTHKQHTHAHTRNHTQIHTHVCIHAHMQSHTETHTYAYKHTCIHAYTHTHTHTHTHAHTQAVLEVSGHKQLLEHNPTLRKLVGMRTPYIDPINILQVCVEKRELVRLPPQAVTVTVFMSMVVYCVSIAKIMRVFVKTRNTHFSTVDTLTKHHLCVPWQIMWLRAPQVVYTMAPTSLLQKPQRVK